MNMGKRATTVLVCGWVCLLVGGCDKIESRENAYSSYAQVQASGNKGMWVPPYLPSTATNIREYHYVDSPSVWIAFNPASEDSAWLAKAHCSSTPEAPEFPSSKRIYVEWWPKDLTAERESSDRHTRYQYYNCRGELGGVLAIEVSESGAAFFWR